MAAVEEDVEDAVAGERGDQVFMEGVAGDLAIALEVNLWGPSVRGAEM